MGEGGAQKPASEPRQVQELGRVCLGRKLYIFAFVFYLIFFYFLIEKAILSHLSMTKNVYLPNLYRAWSGHGSNSAEIHILLNCQQQPGKWDYECQTRERCSLADASQAASAPFGKRQIATRCSCRVGGAKCFSCRKSCSLSGQIIACKRLL